MTDCGTYAGYQAHRKAGVGACAPCREAARAYQADHRARSPEQRGREAERTSARGRALTRLAQRHRGEFREIYEDEKRRTGHEGS